MLQAMATEIERQCETIESCYEFTLSYAARGLAGDDGSDAGRQLRDHLTRAAEAMRQLERSCAEALEQEQLAPAEKYERFFEVIKRDAEGAIAAVELVLAQPAIGSQMIDNLNASIHLRALLADLFLVTEILDTRKSGADASAANGSVGPR
jgi:ATPase subunit of ABC transporter with duplicated ATPase domains